MASMLTNDPTPPTEALKSAGSGQKIRIIDSIPTFLTATAVLGPLALPLLWRNPRFKRRTKILGSLAILAFTYFLLAVTGDYFQGQMEMLKEMMEQAKELQTLP